MRFKAHEQQNEDSQKAQTFENSTNLKGRDHEQYRKPAREEPMGVEVDPRLSRGVKAFLKVLNSSGGPPLETLPPLEAREVLANAQASVPVDLQASKSRRRLSRLMAARSN